jgi:hypothetical protein
MKRSYWRRDEPQFHSFVALAADTRSEIPLITGVEGSLVSRDERSDATTFFVEFPSGWRHTEKADEATIDAFVLEGEMTVNGQRVATGSYFFVPQRAESVELRSESGSKALIFWNPSMPIFPPPYTDVRVATWHETPWDTTPGRLGVHGGFHKSFRKPDFSGGEFEGGPGGYLRWLMMMPGYSDGRQHVHHQCWEEVFLLRGDLFMPGRGTLGFGGYLANPQELWHAPIASQSGALTIVQTDAPMGTWEYREYPNGTDVVHDYLDTSSWLALPEHRDWESMPERRGNEASPEYEAWLKGPGSVRWGDAVGRGTASDFRAMYSRKHSSRERATTGAESASGL